MTASDGDPGGRADPKDAGGPINEGADAAREALRLSEERLALAVQGSGVGVWDWNLETDAVYFSPEWAGMLGYEVSELAPRAQTLVDLLHPDDGKRFAHTLGAYFAQQSVDIYRDDVRLRCKNGRYKWVEFKGRVVEASADGTPRRAVGLSLDLSERKALEEQLQLARQAAEEASRAKGEFLANMSHEIRTPMNGVLGLTELCLATPLTPEQRGYLELAHASAESLLGVINDVLDFSKIEANRLDIVREPFDAAQTLRHALAPLRHRAQRAGLQLLAQWPEALNPWRWGDAQRLRQVLVNLVGNAIKFTEVGQVSVTVEALPTPADAPTAPPAQLAPETAWLRFTVSDTGVGMSEAQQARVFEAFAQADGSIARRYGGTGLGLSISQRLVGLMGGRLALRSRLGEGSTFWFDLPLPEAHPQPVPDPAGAEIRLPAGLRALLVEDHPVNQLVARKVLEHLGLEVTLATDGQAAVRACAQGGLDVVFMDIQMPGIDGFEATRRIREHEARTGRAPVPIIAMTAHALAGYRQRCEDGGMDGYVTKPIARSALVQELSRVLRGRFPPLP